MLEVAKASGQPYQRIRSLVIMLLSIPAAAIAIWLASLAWRKRARAETFVAGDWYWLMFALFCAVNGFAALIYESVPGIVLMFEAIPQCLLPAFVTVPWPPFSTPAQNDKPASNRYS